MKPCAGRHHEWQGDRCKKCNAPKRGPGRPKKKAGEAAGKLAAALGVTAPPPGSIMQGAPGSVDLGGANGQEPRAAEPGEIKAPAAATQTLAPSGEVAAGGAETPKAGEPAAPVRDEKKRKRLWQAVGKRLTKLFVAGTEFALEKAGRRANDPDDDDVEDFQDALAEQLAIWFPDMEMGPGAQMLLAGTCIVSGMAIGSEKIPEKPKPIVEKAQPGTPRLQSVPPPPDPPPYPSPPTAPARDAASI